VIAICTTGFVCLFVVVVAMSMRKYKQLKHLSKMDAENIAKERSPEVASNDGLDSAGSPNGDYLSSPQIFTNVDWNKMTSVSSMTMQQPTDYGITAGITTPGFTSGAMHEATTPVGGANGSQTTPRYLQGEGEADVNAGFAKDCCNVTAGNENIARDEFVIEDEEQMEYEVNGYATAGYHANPLYQMHQTRY